MASANTTGDKKNPFPGLRPFTAGDCDYFFGRQNERKEVAEKLLRNRFVALTGSSGSGKSSLMHCGVVPAIMAGSKGKSSWRVLSIKPGNDPVGNLADAFATSDINSDGNKTGKEGILRLLNEDPDGISAIFGRFPSREGEKTLLLIDQFEELFRYGDGETGKEYGEVTATFLNLITRAVTNNKNAFYAIIALRSELISECERFKVFTRIVNNSNFLLPGMTEENLREVITGPLKKAGTEIDEELVEVMLNDLNGLSDQLPVLQHALMRTWNRWRELDEPDRPLSLSDYNAIGTMKDAISRHADEEYEKLDPEDKKICEKLFRIITGIGPDKRGIRFPSDIRTIKSAIRCSLEELVKVTDRFRDPSIALITPYNVPLDDNSVIDLSHESLIRLWERLKRWVDEENASVEMYLHLSELSALYQQGKTGLLMQPDLQLAIKWREVNNPTLWWAQKYNPAFERAMVYLRTSEKAFNEAEEQKIKQHRWRLSRIRILTSILGGIAVVTALSFGLMTLSKINSDRQRKEALKQNKEFATKKSLAEQYAALALRSAVESDSVASSAEMEAARERKMREAAENKYKQARAETDSFRRISQVARYNEKNALEESSENRDQMMISLAKSMALRSLQIGGKTDLQALLAYQAYLFNKNNNGKANDADIYTGLYQVAKENGSKNYRTFSGHDGPVKSFAFIPGTREFFTSGSDGKVLRWNLDEGAQNFRVVYSGTEIIEVLAVSPNVDWLACGEENAGIRMIPINGEGSAYELKGHSGKIKSLVFSFDGKSLYSAALDGTVLKWDLTARTSTNMVDGTMQITSVDLSYNGKYLAGISPEGKALVWNPEDKSDNFRLEAAGKAIRSIKFRPDDERIAVGYSDGTIEIWDISTRRKASEFIAHSGAVSDIRFNTRFTQMATSGSDGSMKLWDTGNLSALPVTFNDNGGLVIALEFSPDGEVILSGSFESKPQVTGRPTYADAFAPDGCKYVTRNFTPEEWLTYVGKDVSYEKTCPGADIKIRIREIK